MMDRLIRIFLALSCIMLATSLLDRPRVLPPIEVSDNGIVPPALLSSIVKEDAILDRPVEGLKLDDSALEKAVFRLSSASKTEIAARWQTLEGAGIDRTAPVHVQLRRGTLRQALTWLADNLGLPYARLSYSVEGDTVAFSTSDDFYRDITTEIYNVRPLIVEVRRSAFEVANGTSMTSAEAADCITRVVTNTVAPDYWRDAGGTVGSIRVVGGLLIVGQTRKSQRAIATLLTRLDSEMRK